MPSLKDRKGHPFFFTLDYDAVALLKAMVPSQKGRGALLSELVRKEAERRAERPELLARLTAEAVEVGK